MLKVLNLLEILNQTIFYKINYLTNQSILPYILHIISNLFLISNFAIVYIVACCYFYFKIRHSSNAKELFTPIYQELVRIGLCYMIFGFTFAGLKFLTNIPRPFCSLTPDQFITIASIEYERCLSSFPSAHTGLSILTTHFVWRHINNVVKIMFCIISILVAISRITLAMHYPSDIIYSILVTCVIIRIGNGMFYMLKSVIIDPINNLIIRWIL